MTKVAVEICVYISNVFFSFFPLRDRFVCHLNEEKVRRHLKLWYFAKRSDNL